MKMCHQLCANAHIFLFYFYWFSFDGRWIRWKILVETVKWPNLNLIYLFELHSHTHTQARTYAHLILTYYTYTTFICYHHKMFKGDATWQDRIVWILCIIIIHSHKWEMLKWMSIEMNKTHTHILFWLEGGGAPGRWFRMARAAKDDDQDRS